MPTTARPHEGYTTHTLELSDGTATARLVFFDDEPMLHLHVRNASPDLTEDHSCRIAFDTTEAADLGRWLVDRAEEFAGAGDVMSTIVWGPEPAWHEVLRARLWHRWKRLLRFLRRQGTW